MDGAEPGVLSGRADQRLVAGERDGGAERTPLGAVIAAELRDALPARAGIEAEEVRGAPSRIDKRGADQREVARQRDRRSEPRPRAVRRQAPFLLPAAVRTPIGDDDRPVGAVRGRHKQVLRSSGQRAPELLQSGRGDLGRVPPFVVRALEHVHGTRTRRTHEQPGAGGRERHSEAVSHDRVRRVQRLDLGPVVGPEDAHASRLTLGSGLPDQDFILYDDDRTAEPLRGQRPGGGRRGEDGEGRDDGEGGGQ